jgi:hypothetical protein
VLSIHSSCRLNQSEFCTEMGKKNIENIFFRQGMKHVGNQRSWRICFGAVFEEKRYILVIFWLNSLGINRLWSERLRMIQVPNKFTICNTTVQYMLTVCTLLQEPGRECVGVPLLADCPGRRINQVLYMQYIHM